MKGQQIKYKIGEIYNKFFNEHLKLERRLSKFDEAESLFLDKPREPVSVIHGRIEQIEYMLPHILELMKLARDL